MNTYEVRVSSPQSDPVTLFIVASDAKRARKRARAMCKEVRSAPGDVDDYEIMWVKKHIKP